MTSRESDTHVCKPIWMKLKCGGQVLEACNAAATFFEDRASHCGGGADFEGVFDAVAVLHALVALAESLADATTDSEACTDVLRIIRGAPMLKHTH